MDPLLILGAFLVGMALGRVQAQAKLEPLFQDLRRRVREAEATVAELERQEGPGIEGRMLERIYRN